MFGFGRRSVVGQIEKGAAADESGTVPAESTTRVAPDPAPPAAAEATGSGEKYEVIAPIGRGGMGEVLLIRDRDLRREVAMKVIRPEYASGVEMKRRFVAEAQATSQLDHPGIPPVHDMGTRPDGSLYFTMKVVRGRTLTQVLRDLLLGVKETRREYTLHRLVSILERLAETLGFAHEKGVIHRDLKPENVMLGSYGEVHVMDWGLAKISGAAPDDDPAEPPGEVAVRTDANDSGVETVAGTIQGTVPYMSPEQAHGEPLDRRSDVYALGVILYEMLTLHRAFEGTDILARVRLGRYEPVESRNPGRPVPDSLASLCRRSMDRDPSKRPPTAEAFAAELRAWLDGRAEKERRHQEAEDLATRGREAIARYVGAKGSVEGFEREAERIAASFLPWQSTTEKRPLLVARRAVEDARHAAALAFADSTKLLDAAVIAEPENATARGLLAVLWKGRLDDAERRMDRAAAAHALSRLRLFDDGRLAGVICGDGVLELSSDPPGARVALVRYEDDLGILTPGAERDLGATPLRATPLPMGSYLCILRMPGFPDVRYPVHITRSRRWTGHVRMRTRDEIGAGFAYVPGGPYVCAEGDDMRTIDLPDFVIAERPVTFADWAEFLAAVERESGLGEANKFACEVLAVGCLMTRTPDGRWCPDPGRTSNPAVAARHGAGYEDRLAVVGVSWHDAVAYCEWKSRTTGRTWRLPSEEEREKAARGVDGRAFPWGDLADASLAKCAESREVKSQPEPVGAFPAATSVYGMVDAAGSNWEWTNSPLDPARPADPSRVIRGGSWFDTLRFTRSACRTGCPPGQRFVGLGFRPARSADP